MLLPAGMLQNMSPWNGVPAKTQSANWNALTWDSIAYFYPARLFLGQSLRNGELPLWNPHQMCGTPFLADYQSAVLYPPNWLFAVIPAARAFGILAALHLFALGAFTFLFLRSLSLGRIPSTFGAIAFMLGGFAITWLELPVFLSTGVWLPLVLFLIHKTHMTHRAHYAAGAGVALGLSLLGGHPQIAFYVWMAAGLYWAYLAIAARKFPWSAILAFGIGLALAAPQLLPSIELARLSHRGGSPTAEGYAAYSALAMPWRHLITFLFPDMGGASGWYPEYCGYVGVLPVVFMFFAFKRKNQSWFFAGLGILALLMAMGAGINRLFYFGIPGFSHSGSPARVLFLYMFSVAILGGIGLERFLDWNEKIRIRRRWFGLLMIWGVAVLLLAFGFFVNPTSKPADVYPPTPLTDSLKTKDFARILPMNDRWSLVAYPNAVLPPNSAAVYGLYDVQGYDAFYPVRYKALLDTAAGRDSSPQENGNMVFARNPESPVYDLLGVRWIIADDGKAQENPGAFPRAFLVHAVEYYEDQDILRQIAIGQTDLRSVALVNVGSLGRLDAWQHQSQSKPAARDQVTITRYDNNSVALKVEAAKAGVLVLTDQYYPGWKATMDGKPVHIEQVDYVFRGVPMYPGKHTVTFSYHPRSFERGRSIAITALILVAIIALSAAVKARHRS